MEMIGMDIKKLIGIKDKEQFEDKLGDELGADFECLPLEEGCEEGGYPDAESVYVYDVRRTGEDDERIYASFSVSFSEAFNTSCGDCVVEKPRDIDCRIVIDKFMEESEISRHVSDHEPEF
jgi:hypothetical protein